MANPLNSTNLPRRGFLLGLAKLPLIGGSIAILGQPTSAATPITVPLLERYHAFLSRETAATLAELYSLAYTRTDWGWSLDDVDSYRHKVPMGYLREDETVEHMIAARRPSTRAAVVLSAAGLPLAAQ